MSYHKPKECHYRFTATAKRKKIVRQIARNAMLDGRIVLKPCEVCGESRVEMHHVDYSKPFDVKFLCRKHHMEIHFKERHERANRLCKDCGQPKEPHRVVKASRCLKCHNEFCKSRKHLWHSNTQKQIAA